MSRLDFRRGSASCLPRNPHPIKSRFSLPAWGTPILTGIFLLAALFALQPRQVAAQEFRGTISGTVTDSTGAAIPGANVTVTETSSGTTSKTVSNSAGQYVIPLLLPGHYTITVQKEGFKQAVRKGIALDATAHLIIDLQMEIGSA